MGFWEDFQSAVDELKRSSSNSFEDTCRKSYDNATCAAGQIGAAGREARDRLQSAAAGAWNHASRAAGEVDRALRVEAPRWIAGWMPPEEDKRREIARVLQEAGMKAADVAIREAARSVPYGPEAYGLLKEVSANFLRMKGGRALSPRSSAADPVLWRKVETLEAELLDLRAHLAALSEHLTKSGALPSATPPLAGVQPDRASSTPPAVGIRGPSDVIGVFLREGFKGADFLDTLIVPEPRGKATGASPAAIPDV